MRTDIIYNHSSELMKEIEDKSVNLVVTSRAGAFLGSPVRGAVAAGD